MRPIAKKTKPLSKSNSLKYMVNSSRNPKSNNFIIQTKPKINAPRILVHGIPISESQKKLMVHSDSSANSPNEEPIVLGEKLNRQNSNVNLRLTLRSQSKNFLKGQLLKTPGSINLDLLSMKKTSQNTNNKDMIFLKLKKEALQRPYSPEAEEIINYKEFSVTKRNEYWQKKKLEQFRISRNKNIFQSTTPTIKLMRKRKKKRATKRNLSLENAKSAYSLTPALLTNLYKSTSEMNGDTLVTNSERKKPKRMVFGESMSNCSSPTNKTSSGLSQCKKSAPSSPTSDTRYTSLSPINYQLAYQEGFNIKNFRSVANPLINYHLK